ncbi:hypothetical protein POL68_39460 [Stigmatella sp. ncwal1]|uniref:Fibronectin type-III domain-containing protein n=1 Tax=Stigmatella ashevillensis TaxID=2995309 RepID=A0ABT5DLW5_9BACT|nr:hypothetical protein [Stigmatella ashevillena]MDC0714593.1 hypothetical protein [Stigmatella ashevillena]
MRVPMPLPFPRAWTSVRLLTALLLPLGVSALSCGDDASSPPPSGEAQDSVTGQRSITRRLETGDTRARDTTGVIDSLSVLIPQGDAFETRPVIVTGEGTFRFDDVPQDTPYYLKRGSGTYVVTGHRQLDLDEYVLGREGVVTVTAGLPVTMTVEGLAPLDARPNFEMVAPNAGAAGLIVLESEPPAGSTQLTGQPGHYRSSFGRQEVIDETRGDRLYVLQSQSNTSGDLNYRSITRALSLTQTTFQTNGQATPLAGTFQPVAMKEATVDWRRSSFEVHRAAVHPLAVPLGTSSVRHTLILAPAPGGVAQGVVGYAGELLSGSILAASQDVKATVVYGDPYPATWGVVANVVHRYQLPLRLRGTTGTVGASLVDQAELQAFLSRPVEARLSPPTRLQVDGRDAQQEHDLTSRTPLLTWEAPSVGTANVYDVRIFRLYKESGEPDFTYTETVATLLTAQRQVRIPPGVLQPEQAYVVRIGAMLTPGVDLTRSPYQLNTLVDYAVAETLTSVLHAP